VFQSREAAARPSSSSSSRVSDAASSTEGETGGRVPPYRELPVEDVAGSSNTTNHLPLEGEEIDPPPAYTPLALPLDGSLPLEAAPPNTVPESSLGQRTQTPRYVPFIDDAPSMASSNGTHSSSLVEEESNHEEMLPQTVHKPTHTPVNPSSNEEAGDLDMEITEQDNHDDQAVEAPSLSSFQYRATNQAILDDWDFGQGDTAASSTEQPPPAQTFTHRGYRPVSDSILSGFDFEPTGGSGSGKGKSPASPAPYLPNWASLNPYGSLFGRQHNTQGSSRSRSKTNSESTNDIR
jgi:hypothetical protein